ncbi:MAG TPA: hypothetical protein VFO71_08920 [Gemmatimonadales bacterium]|nr:hypothetical protein [Gemmatimonadales bacterium]
MHGDTEGADVLRRSLTDWLLDMDLVQAGNAAVLDRYIGYYEPYATSHAALDGDAALQEEVRNAARTLVNMVRLMRMVVTTALMPPSRRRSQVSCFYRMYAFAIASSGRPPSALLMSFRNSR